MSIPKFLFWICWFGLTACLAGSFLLFDQRLLALFALISAGVWVLAAVLPAAQHPDSWLPVLGLVSSVGLSAIGLLLHVLAPFMLLAATLSLACWDLTLFEQSQSSQAPAAGGSRLEQKHLQSLGAALVVGLLVASLGQAFSLQIPFLGMVGLVALAVASLDRVIHAIQFSKTH